MKKLWIILGGIIFISSCKDKKAETELTPYDQVKSSNGGTASALINGQAWVASISTSKANYEYSDRLDLSFSVYESGIERQNLVLTRINPNVTDQKLYSSLVHLSESTAVPRHGKDTCLASFYLLQDDVLEDTYEILESASDNNLHIDKFDVTNKKVEGTFSLTLYRDNIKQALYQNFADTLRVTSGKFEIRLK